MHLNLNIYISDVGSTLTFMLRPYAIKLSMVLGVVSSAFVMLRWYGTKQYGFALSFCYSANPCHK